MNFDIKVIPSWTDIVMQLVSTLFLIGLIALFIYFVFKLPKSLKKISVLQEKVENIEETLKRIEDKVTQK